MAALSDQYLVDLIRQGGSSYGKPGMPSFGFTLTDAEITALVSYLRNLARAPRDLVGPEQPPGPTLAAGASGRGR
jgi:mono/diheme cytochrome c family protein